MAVAFPCVSAALRPGVEGQLPAGGAARRRRASPEGGAAGRRKHIYPEIRGRH